MPSLSPKQVCSAQMLPTRGSWSPCLRGSSSDHSREVTVRFLQIYRLLHGLEFLWIWDFKSLLDGLPCLRSLLKVHYILKMTFLWEGGSSNYYIRQKILEIVTRKSKNKKINCMSDFWWTPCIVFDGETWRETFENSLCWNIEEHVVWVDWS